MAAFKGLAAVLDARNGEVADRIRRLRFYA